MYSIKKEYSKFSNVAYECIDRLKVNDPSSANRTVLIKDVYDKKSVYISTCGVLNTLWQSWNKFWRIYWLTHIYGGIGFYGAIPYNNIGINTITSKKMCRRLSEGEAIYHLLRSSNWNMNRYRNGSSIPSHQEPTWGDINIIQKVSMRHFTPGNHILSAISIFGNSAIHLQKVRNCSIHLTKSGMIDLESSIIPSYKISNIKYPTDIIFSEALGSNKMALNEWVDELTALLELI